MAGSRGSACGVGKKRGRNMVDGKPARPPKRDVLKTKPTSTWAARKRRPLPLGRAHTNGDIVVLFQAGIVY